MRSSSLRVLLIDDDRDDYLITRDLCAEIEEINITLEWKPDYSSGLEALRNNEFGACLLDYRLAGKNGLDFLRDARDEGCIVPIILFTGQADAGLEKAALEIGAADYLVKSAVNRESLSRALRFAAQRNSALSEMRAQDRLFRAVFDSALDAKLITDDSCHILDSNRAASVLTGLPHKELVGIPLSRIMSLASAPAPRPTDWAKFFKAGGGHGEMAITGALGTSVSVQFSAAADVLPGRNLLVIRDVTEKKKLAASAAISDRLVSVGMLAAGVAHEINNPLAALVGYLQLAVEKSHSLPAVSERDEIQEYLTVASEAAQRVRVTTNDLKLFAQSKSTSMGSVEVQATLESSLRMVWNEIRHRAKVLKSYDAVPPIFANESRLGQVFLNLLVNASQSIPAGNADENFIRLTIRDEGKQIRIEIADSGSGMTPEVMKNIFDPFYTTKNNLGGTGLGLSICKKIVDDMNGSITVDSLPGRGSTFALCFPISEASKGAPAAAEAPSSAAKIADRRGKVLVIDDEDGLLKLLELVVSREHETSATSDPRDALRRIDLGEKFDAILCDMMMPNISGVEFYKQLQKKHPAQAGRFIFMSGGLVDAAHTDMEAGLAIRRVEKPFDLKKLMDTLREVVGS